ncbi:hypothetical protein [Polaromonas sp. SP1]|uniref:hypothetical protein n=1 Tax=unclassified Polaromonas TaxID=2638319 RepID=UPI0035130B45
MLIDLDGTMVDTLGDFAQALNLMLADLLPGDASAARLDAEAVELMVGKGSEHLVKSALKHVQAQMGSAPAVILVASYEQAYAGYQRHCTGSTGRYLIVCRDGVLAL